MQLNDAATSGAALPEALDGDDLELLLQRFLVSIASLADAQAGAVRVLTDDGHHMRLVAQQGLPPHVQEDERLVDRGCGTCGTAVDGDVLDWIDDVRTCNRKVGGHYFGGTCQAVLAISLTHGGQVLGIYNLFFESRVELPGATQTMLRLIGQLLGLTLHNARIERERLRVTVLRERQEMVNEVHDSIAQTLAFARMRLPLLNDAMLAHDDQKANKFFLEVKQAVGEVHDNLREVMTYFRTRMDPLGLLHALGGIADAYFGRTGIALEIRNSVRHLNLSDAQEIQVFYIVQESLANIAKHSMARHATIIINKTPAMLEFVIEDDGLGLASPSVSTIVTSAKELGVSNHFGLTIMQNRAQRLGASLTVGDNEGGGTRVRLLLPTDAIPTAKPPP